MSKRLATPADVVRDFRRRHKLDQPTLDAMMGFGSEGRAVRHWEAKAAPYPVSMIFAYADKYGLDILEEFASQPVLADPDCVKKFRSRHGISGAELDRLMGLAPGGRATRRWEADGAPYNCTLLIRYADKYGIELLEEMALARERQCQPA
jgi:hypothetical protein